MVLRTIEDLDIKTTRSIWGIEDKKEAIKKLYEGQGSDRFSANPRLYIYLSDKELCDSENIVNQINETYHIDFIYDNWSKLDELSFQFIDSKRSNLKDDADHFRRFLNSNMHIFWAMCLDSIMGDELNKQMYNSQEMNYMKIDVQQQLEILSARNF